MPPATRPSPGPPPDPSGGRRTGRTRSRTAGPRPAWTTPLAWAAAAGAATAVVAAADPTSHHVPLCPVKAATGLDCPFCGSLRAVWFLTRGRIGDALSMNALVTVAIPVVIVGWAWWLGRTLTGRPAPTAPPWFGGLAVVVLVAFGVARLLGPFSVLGTGP